MIKRYIYILLFVDDHCTAWQVNSQWITLAQILCLYLFGVYRVGNAYIYYS